MLAVGMPGQELYLTKISVSQVRVTVCLFMGNQLEGNYSENGFFSVWMLVIADASLKILESAEAEVRETYTGRLDRLSISKTP